VGGFRAVRPMLPNRQERIVCSLEAFASVF
jgi:hypothetical protein